MPGTSRWLGPTASLLLSACGLTDALSPKFETTSSPATGWTRHKLATKGGLDCVWGSGSVVVAAGDNGTVVHSSDGGQTFAAATLGLPGGTALDGTTLSAVWGSGPNDVWMIGTPAVLFHSTDGGANWSPSSTTFANTYFYTLFGTGPNDVYIGAGDSIRTGIFRLYHSTDGGKTWPAVESQLAAEVIGGSGPTNLYRGGGGGLGGAAQLLHSGNGSDWQTQTAPASWFQLAYVAALPAEALVAASDSPMYGYNDLLYHTSDGGQTLQPLAARTYHDIRGLVASSDGAFHLVDNPAILRSTDHGATWTQEGTIDGGQLYRTPDLDNQALWVSPAGKLFVAGFDTDTTGFVLTNAD